MCFVFPQLPPCLTAPPPEAAKTSEPVPDKKAQTKQARPGPKATSQASHAAMRELTVTHMSQEGEFDEKCTVLLVVDADSEYDKYPSPVTS